MGPEIVKHNQSKFEKEKIGHVRVWSEMLSYLPKIDPHDQRYVEVYFRTQVLFVEEKKVKARRLSGLLTKFTGFADFEDKHENLMAAVDIAVRGRTGREVAPALKLNEKG